MDVVVVKFIAMAGNSLKTPFCIGAFIVATVRSVYVALIHNSQIFIRSSFSGM